LRGFLQRNDFNKLCNAGIVFIRKRLVLIARFLCCVRFDAAMQKLQSLELSSKWIRFLWRTGAAFVVLMR